MKLRIYFYKCNKIIQLFQICHLRVKIEIKMPTSDIRCKQKWLYMYRYQENIMLERFWDFFVCSLTIIHYWTICIKLNEKAQVISFFLNKSHFSGFLTGQGSTFSHVLPSFSKHITLQRSFTEIFSWIIRKKQQQQNYIWTREMHELKVLYLIWFSFAYN